MRAVTFSGFGGIEVLGVGEVPMPEIGPTDVLVKVVSSAMNRADLLQRMGLYSPPPGATEVPGLEFAGEVVEVGSQTQSTKVGDRVMGIVSGGAHSEFVATPERMLLQIPERISTADAAAIPEAFITAFDALVIQGGLRSGHWALVHAGASGVGTAAIQVAKAIGANMIVTASSKKLKHCSDLGADVVVDYAKESFLEAAREATDGRGVDVVLDVIGPAYLNDNIACVRTAGRVIQVGLMGGMNADFNMGALLMNRVQLIGTTLRSRPIEEKIAKNQQFAAEILPLVAKGLLSPVIDSRFPLEKIADAHAYMESNANVGKIMLDVVE